MLVTNLVKMFNYNMGVKFIYKYVKDEVNVNIVNSADWDINISVLDIKLLE